MPYKLTTLPFAALAAAWLIGAFAATPEHSSALARMRPDAAQDQEQTQTPPPKPRDAAQPDNQKPPAADAKQSPTATADREPLSATVIELVGDVQHAPLGTRDWKPCQVDDAYPPKTKIRTGLRASIKLKIGEEEPYTAMIIESVGLVSLAEAFKTKTTKRVRIGVGYGKVRAGVAEGGLESDFTIDTPVVTLSKRGTWNFGLSYERFTDRFEVFLIDRGLIDALNQRLGVNRRLWPREVVTQVMRRWLDEAPLRRNVAVADLFGQQDFELAFNRLRLDGLGILHPGQGQIALLDLSSSFARHNFAQILREQLGPFTLPPMLVPTPGGQRHIRPEGFFGSGRGDQLVPILINPNSALVKRGFARPGTYKFRRAAVQNWLKRNKK